MINMTGIENIRIRVSMLYEAPYPREEIYTLAQTEYLLFGRGAGVVAIDGKVLNSYKELEKIAIEKYNEREIIDVILLPLFDGG